MTVSSSSVLGWSPTPGWNKFNRQFLAKQGSGDDTHQQEMLGNTDKEWWYKGYRVIEMEVLFNHGKPSPNNNGLTAKELAERKLDSDIMDQTPMRVILDDMDRNRRLANGDTAKEKQFNAELSEPMRARTESILLDLKAKSKNDFLRLTLIEERLALFKPGMATH